MAGLFGAAWLGFLGVLGIKDAIDNEDRRNTSTQQSYNGIKYYTDTRGQTRLVSNNHRICCFFNGSERIVDLDDHHKVICDQAADAYWRKNEYAKKLTADDPDYTVIISDMSHGTAALIERATGKRIACVGVWRDKGKWSTKRQYRKFYWYDNGLFAKFPDLNDQQIGEFAFVPHNNIVINDYGILISKEEYFAILDRAIKYCAPVGFRDKEYGYCDKEGVQNDFVNWASI